MNNYLQQLIDRFWSNELTNEQKQALLQHLSREHPQWVQELEAAYQASLANSTGEKLPAPNYFQQQLEVLKSAIAPHKTIDKQRSLPWYANRWWQAAAVLLVVAGLGSIFYFNRRVASPQPVQVTNTVVVKDTSLPMIISNKEQATRSERLRDGSIVLLEPGCTLRYTAAYGQSERAIELQAGQAFFKVAKDKTRPFRVMAAGVSVQALGTAFRVKLTGSHKITVLLTEGSVGVQTGLVSAAGKPPVVLKPGEELIVDRQQASMQLVPAAAQQQQPAPALLPASERTKPRSVLQFDQQPLGHVFHAIEKYYKVRIAFREQDVHGLWFTGSFRQGDPLTIVLTTICKVNRLRFHFEEGAYIVSKK